MDEAIRQFETNLSSARQLGLIHASLAGRVTRAIRLEELLRAELVLVVAALDCLVHDLVRAGMTRSFRFAAQKPVAYRSFRVSLDVVDQLVRAGDLASQVALLDQEIRRLHGFQTFQRAEHITQALALLGMRGVWEKTARPLGMPSAQVKAQLNLIVDRRNRIVHESDIDPTLGIGEKYPIDRMLVDVAVTFIDKLGHCLNGLVDTALAP
jgi:hypothetical protein